MELQGIGKLLIFAGLVIVALGAVTLLAPKVPLLGRLPGDFLVRKGNFTVFAPLVTMLLVSIVLTVVVNLVFRFFR